MLARLLLFRLFMWPLLQISIGIVWQLNPASFISVDRNSYLALFLSAAELIPEVKGMVSSIKNTVAGSCLRSKMVISGRLFVIITSTGTVDPPMKAPSRSA